MEIFSSIMPLFDNNVKGENTHARYKKFKIYIVRDSFMGDSNLCVH